MVLDQSENYGAPPFHLFSVSFVFPCVYSSFGDDFTLICQVECKYM